MGALNDAIHILYALRGVPYDKKRFTKHWNPNKSDKPIKIGRPLGSGNLSWVGALGYYVIGSRKDRNAAKRWMINEYENQKIFHRYTELSGYAETHETIQASALLAFPKKTLLYKLCCEWWENEVKWLALCSRLNKQNELIFGPVGGRDNTTNHPAAEMNASILLDFKLPNWPEKRWFRQDTQSCVIFKEGLAKPITNELKDKLHDFVLRGNFNFDLLGLYSSVSIQWREEGSIIYGPNGFFCYAWPRLACAVPSLEMVSLGSHSNSPTIGRLHTIGINNEVLYFYDRSDNKEVGRIDPTKYGKLISRINIVGTGDIQ